MLESSAVRWIRSADVISQRSGSGERRQDRVGGAVGGR